MTTDSVEQLRQWASHCRDRHILWANRAREDDAIGDKTRCEWRENIAGCWRSLAELADAAEWRASLDGECDVDELVDHVVRLVTLIQTTPDQRLAALLKERTR